MVTVAMWQRFSSRCERQHPETYRVSYFERAAEMNPTQQERGSRAAMDPRKPKDTAAVGKEPTALIHLPKLMHSKNVAAGGETMAEKPESVPDAPASISIVSGRAGLLSEVTGKSEQERQMEEIPPAMVNPSISIEDRMAALQSKLVAGGKIKRSKPKTMPDNYRSPYAD